jgi:hypothetical protein
VGVLLTARFALVGVVTGAMVSPWAARRQAWVTARREALDRAIVATRKANLRRNYLLLPRKLDTRHPQLGNAVSYLKPGGRGTGSCRV